MTICGTCCRNICSSNSTRRDEPYLNQGMTNLIFSEVEKEAEDTKGAQSKFIRY